MLEEKQQRSGFCSLGFHPLVSSPSNFVEGSGIVVLLFLAAAFKMTEPNLSNGYSLEKTWVGVRGRAGWNRFDPWHHTASPEPHWVLSKNPPLLGKRKRPPPPQAGWLFIWCNLVKKWEEQMRVRHDNSSAVFQGPERLLARPSKQNGEWSPSSVLSCFWELYLCAPAPSSRPRTPPPTVNCGISKKLLWLGKNTNDHHTVSRVLKGTDGEKAISPENKMHNAKSGRENSQQPTPRDFSSQPSFSFCSCSFVNTECLLECDSGFKKMNNGKRWQASLRSKLLHPAWLRRDCHLHEAPCFISEI